MYVLDYLAGRYANRSDTVISEFRLLCSGVLYNARVQALEWQKSDAARSLLTEPCKLAVLSQPLDEYPQELCLLLTSPEHVTETVGNSTRIFPPDDDIAQDMAVLFTVFLRRLVTVYAKVRRTHLRNQQSGIEQCSNAEDVRLPIVSAATRVAWKRKPLGVVWGIGGVQSVIDDNPLPLRLNPTLLSTRLNGVGSIRHGDTFLMAARLYWQALRMIEEWPEIAYQLLVYCVETVANRKYSDYSPSRAEMVAAKGGVAKRARKYGLTQQQAEDLAVLACSGMSWAFRKFQMFLEAAKDNVTKDGDDLFRLPSVFDPPADKFDQVISGIYGSRSAAAHRGKAYGASVGLGTAPLVPVPAVLEILSGSQEVPPVPWFERLVNAALCHYVDAEIAFHARVRERAYQIFEERGKEHGHDLDDWLKAEAELSA